MSKLRKHLTRPRHGTVAAYLSLFIALGGTSYAAVNLPAGSVGTRQLRNHSITPSKLNPGRIGAVVRYWATVSGSGRVLESGSVRPRTTMGSAAGHPNIIFGPKGTSGRCFVLGNVTTGAVATFQLLGNHQVFASTSTPSGVPVATTVSVAVLCSP